MVATKVEDDGSIRVGMVLLLLAIEEEGNEKARADAAKRLANKKMLLETESFMLCSAVTFLW